MSINTSFQWTVYFPITKTYDFTISADNEAIIRLDGVDVVSTNYSAGERGPYQNTFSGSTQVTQGYHSIVIVAINTGGPGAVGGRITSTTGTAVSVAPVVVDPRTGSARDGYYTRTGSTNPEVTNNSFFNAYTLQGFRRLNTDAELEQESSSQIRQYIVRQNNVTVWDNTSPPPAQYLPGTFRGSKYGISADGTLTQGDGYPNDGSGLGDFLNAFDLAVGSGGQTIEIWNSRNPRNNKRKTLGQNGKDHTAGTFDGGGGGGGGGGYVGGAGGYFGGNVAGDLGGGAGFIGRSYVENNDSDSGIIKPALSDRQAAYNNFGTGGDGGTPGISATDGTSGVAVVNATFLTRSLYHKIDNNWKTTKNVFVKDGGIWKSCAEVWVKHNDVWKRSLLKTDSTVVWLSDPPPAPPPTPVEPSLPDPPTITPIEFPNPPRVTPPTTTPVVSTPVVTTPVVTTPVVITPVVIGTPVVVPAVVTPPVVVVTPPVVVTTVVEDGGGDGVTAVGDVGESVSVSDADAAAAGTAAAAGAPGVAGSTDATAAADNSGNTSGDGGGGGKIICKKLAEMGFFDDTMNAADQKFGAMLRDQDPDAYHGYLRWAQPVVDLLEGKGSVNFRKIIFFWVQDEQLRQQMQSNIVAHYLDVIARPWAEEMAYRMKAEGHDHSNPAGRFIMNIGLPMCRAINRFGKRRELPMWLKTVLIWGTTTVLLVAVTAISTVDTVINRVRNLFKGK